MVAQPTVNNAHLYQRIKESKVKVTRPINARTVNAQYIPNGNAYEVQSWYTDRVEDHYH